MALSGIPGNQIDIFKATAYPNLYDGQPRWDGTNLVVNQGGSDVIIGPNTAALNGTFEWEAKRTTGISNAGLTTVAFGGTFAEYPVVVAVCEKGDAATNVPLITDITKTNFKVRSDSASGHAVHWFACTPGTWLVNSNIVRAGIQTNTNNGTTNFRHPIDFYRPFPKTPANLHAYYATQNSNITGPNSCYAMYMPFAGGTPDYDSAIYGYSLAQQNNGTTVYAMCYISVQSTGAAQNTAGAFTSPGASTLKVSVPFEAGFFRKSGAGTGPFTATFSAAFPSAPAVLLGAASVDAVETASIQTVDTAPLTTSFDYNHNGGAGTGMGWLAVKVGFDSTTARRLI